MKIRVNLERSKSIGNLLDRPLVGRVGQKKSVVECNLWTILMQPLQWSMIERALLAVSSRIANVEALDGTWLVVVEWNCED